MLPVRRSLRYAKRRSYTLYSETTAFEGRPIDIVEHPSLGVEPVGNFATGPDQDLLVLAERYAM